MSVSTESPAPARSRERTGLSEHRVQLWCAWCAPVFTVMLFGGMLLAGFVPPPTPGQTAQQVADHYARHTDVLRLGLLLIFVGGGLTAPFVVAVDHQLRRIPGAGSMALLQVIGGTVNVLAVIVPTLIFMAAAFRPERSPEITQALHDTAFIPFIGNFVPFTLQAVAIGVAVLMQPASRPVLPRWVGFWNLWTALLVLPGGLLIFFRGGAFAWNGAINFWVVAVVFGSWFLVMFAVLRAAILRERA